MSITIKVTILLYHNFLDALLFLFVFEGAIVALETITVRNGVEEEKIVKGGES